MVTGTYNVYKSSLNLQLTFNVTYAIFHRSVMFQLEMNLQKCTTDDNNIKKRNHYKLMGVNMQTFVPDELLLLVKLYNSGVITN